MVTPTQKTDKSRTAMTDSGPRAEAGLTHELGSPIQDRKSITKHVLIISFTDQ